MASILQPVLISISLNAEYPSPNLGVWRLILGDELHHFLPRIFSQKTTHNRPARIARVFFHPLLLHTLTIAVASIAPYLPYGELGGSRSPRPRQLLRHACHDSHNSSLDNIRR